MRTVKSSNRPMSIRMAKNHLAPDGNHAKLSVGPTFPMPGPTFPNDVATAPRAVSKLTPSNMVITIEPMAKIRIYIIIKATAL